ncbi:MBOAT family O-acyltransferase [Alysiella filiformis]|uniref:Probable alginate O-acetylase AlgI n=1 Tax=Alysiella filiformis DSM 16848 TaxID=1120981 RepID=A0A286ELN9_9NEIS|nr:MBOAT family protein [Alysiella filiformis]QMT31668.1 MBOAT family protein [Alysiella filiformis]UBQ55322.1 MBOAT family protein [Alysiella filiformis DSM 16848]SOD71850.1 D-alanyl-lipoteichoic acid acyltransferase DltB, MBOAT superfamily [Alysiella filiformis DSM 16848]
MPLLSIEFALCFLIFLPIYWSLHRSPRWQNRALLAASLLYLCTVHWAVALAVVWFALAIWQIAFKIQSSEHAKSRKMWLSGGIVLALANLGLFKYFDFFRPAFQAAFGDNVADWVMPLGISYYTFQAIAYLLAIYRRENVGMIRGDLLLHFSFFPTITSGPIIRAGSLKSIYGTQMGFTEQVQTTQPRQMVRPALALALIALGLAKKWWLSGMLAENWVNPVFENPLQYDALSAWAAVLGYTFQLFLDFSGYTDLVLGMAMLLGFRLPENFNMPLRAVNIRDFWERWHITLSTWIRDYIYIPLGGSRQGFVRTQVNVMLAMLLSGIWHGYGWNFLLWGALHGVAFVVVNSCERTLGKHYFQNRFGTWAAVGLTFLFVSVSFIIFRTHNLGETGQMFTALLGGGQQAHMAWSALGMIALMVAVVAAYPKMNALFQAAVLRLERLPYWTWSFILAAIMMILMAVAPSGIPGFIYANF